MAWGVHRGVERLTELAGDRLLAFEHGGSTAIEGVAAKAIIGLLAVVTDTNETADLRAVLEASRYEVPTGRRRP